MIYQETMVGYTTPTNLVGTIIQQESGIESILFGDKNPNKPPKKKQKKKKAVEEPPVKRKRKKRKKKAA